jgi:hypothetical protein
MIENFHNTLDKHKMEVCSRCKERWFEMRLEGGVCRVCRAWDSPRKMKEGMPFLMTDLNNMDPRELPVLPKLTQMEEMCIAWAHVHMQVKRVWGHQYHYTGNCVSFMQNTVRFFDTLPLLPEEMDIVLLYPKKSSLEDPQYKHQFREEFKVRRSAILQWLVYLKEHHPDYRDINTSGSRLDTLPTDDDVIHRVARFEMDEPESSSEEGPI